MSGTLCNHCQIETRRCLAVDSLLISTMFEKQPNSTIPQLAEAAGISLTAVNKQLRLLTEKGYITRTAKDNFWRLIITPSL